MATEMQLFTMASLLRRGRAMDRLSNALTLFGLGFSWGGFESLAISCDRQL